MFVRNAEEEGRRGKKRKKDVGDKKERKKKKKKKKKKKGKCASVIGVVKSGLVDRIYTIIFFSFSFSIILLPIDRFPADHQRKEQGQLVENKKSREKIGCLVVR